MALRKMEYGWNIYTSNLHTIDTDDWTFNHGHAFYFKLKIKKKRTVMDVCLLPCGSDCEFSGTSHSHSQR